MKEAAVLAASLELARLHPAVAGAWRMNTGAFKVQGRFIRCGFPGLSDILLLMRTGHLGAAECKVEDGKLRPEQEIFLNHVEEHGGFIAIVRHPLDLKKALDEWRANH